MILWWQRPSSPCGSERSRGWQGYPIVKSERVAKVAVTATSLRAWLVVHLAELRGIAPEAVDVRERFSRYGLDSLGATRLIAELSQVLDRPLSPTLVWEHTTIEALAGHLAGEPEGQPRAVGEAPEPRDAGEPIAIVGMACRFPGAPDLDAFWRVLADGVDAITDVPADRWDAAALFDADVSAAGKVNTRWGGFVDQVDRFDPQFFGISPREAVQMDPQQRLALELAWEALEDAGAPPPRLAESRTGVFLGALFTDYALLQDRAGPEAITAHSSTGGAACIIANRVSYALGLQGPSLTVDTACSSSLVAVHLACQSLRSGESDMALAGGVSLMLVPETTMGFSRLGAMSPDGRCRAFGAGANGYVRSEGGGVVVLKRLEDALRDGDPIYAIVRGSAVNNDGASNGLTAPNPESPAGGPARRVPERGARAGRRALRRGARDRHAARRPHRGLGARRRLRGRARCRRSAAHRLGQDERGAPRGGGRRGRADQGRAGDEAGPPDPAQLALGRDQSAHRFPRGCGSRWCRPSAPGRPGTAPRGARG